MAQSYGDLIRASAERLGIDPLDWANVISYETIGTFDPKKRGGKDSKYVGLIQMGPEERRAYGGGTDQDFATNLQASERYMKARGLKPGMNLLDIYSTINAGSPGHPQANDGNNTVEGHVQEMLGSYRKKAANLLGSEYYAPASAKAAQGEAERAAPSNAGYGPSTIIGGISNEPMYTARRGNSLVDVNDDEYWKSVAPETVAKAAPATAPAASSVPLGRPAGPLDAPVTENGAAGAAAPAARPAGPLDQPSTENSPTDPAPVTGDTSLQGSAGSNTLAGGDTPDTPEDDLSQFEDAAPTSPGQDDLSQFEEPAPTAPPDDHHTAMTQRSIDTVTEATTPKPLSPLQDSALGLHNLFHNITLGADTGLLGLANPQVSEDLAAGRKQWQATHPYQSFGQGVIGPLPATLAGMGVVGHGLTAAGGEIASAFPSTAGAITQTGRFLSGQLGSWAGSIGDKLARAGNLFGLGALEGAGQGVAQSGLTDQSTLKDAGIGAAIGAPLGMAGGAIGHVLTKDLIADLTAGAREVYNQASAVFTNRAALPQAGRMVAADSPLGQLHSRVISNEAENRNLRAWTDQGMEFAGSAKKEATITNLEANRDAIGNHFDQIIQAANVAEDPMFRVQFGDMYRNLHQNGMHRGAQFNAIRAEMERIDRDLGVSNGIMTPQLYQSIIKSTGALGKLIKSPDGEVSQWGQNIKQTLMDWVDRGFANYSGGKGSMVISGLGTGTPQQLYKAAAKRWKLNETMTDTVEKSGNYSGVLDPQEFAKQSHTGRSLSSEPNDPQRVMVQTAMFMPKTTQQGTAIAASSPAQRFISNIINYGTTIGAAASMAGAARWIGASPGSMAGAAALGAGAASARNAFLRSRLHDPNYLQELLGNPLAIARAAGQQSARRNVLTGAAIGAGNTVYNR